MQADTRQVELHCSSEEQDRVVLDSNKSDKGMLINMILQLCIMQRQSVGFE